MDTKSKEIITFDEYLLQQKIHAACFQQAEAQTYVSWKEMFDVIGSKNFTYEKFFLLNAVRKKYNLTHTK